MKKCKLSDLLNRLCGIIDCVLIILHSIQKGLITEDLSIEYRLSSIRLTYKSRFRKVEKDYQKIEAVYTSMLKLLE